MSDDDTLTPQAAASAATKPTPRIGWGKGEVEIPDSFFEPMPDEWLKQFNEGPIFPYDSAANPSKKPTTASIPLNKFGK